MKRTDVNNFSGPLVSRNGNFSVFSDNYLDTLLLNKIIVLPLQSIRGNIENTIGRDQVILILSGLGSMEVNGTSLTFKQGDIISIKSTERYSIRNDALDSVIQFVSVLEKK